MKLIPVCPFVSLILTPILTFSPLWAQTPAAIVNSPAGDAAAAQTLQVRLVDSESSQTQIGSKTVEGFTVRVTDPAGAVVPNAAVAFRLPDSGATGTFADGAHSAVVYTDTAGRAHVANIQWATAPGVVDMRVTANKGTTHGDMSIEETLLATAAAAAPSASEPLLAAPPISTTVVTVPPPAAAITTPATPSAPAQRATAQTIAKSIGSSQITPGQIAPAQIATVQIRSTQVAPAQQGTSASAAPSTQVANSGAAPQAEPSVSVSSAPPGQAPHSSHAKWFILLAVVAGAGAGVAMVGKGKGSSSAAAPSLAIGSPSISVGQPH